MTMTDDQPIIEIQTVHPVDVGVVRDHGLRAVVSYAASMGWNVRSAKSGSITLSARDGTTVVIPTDTSVRAGFIEAKLRNVVTHTEERRRPTSELVESILLGVKASPEIKRAMRVITGVGEPVVKSLTMHAEPKPISAFRVDAPKIPPPGHRPAVAFPPVADVRDQPIVEVAMPPVEPVLVDKGDDAAEEPSVIKGGNVLKRETGRTPYVASSGASKGTRLGVVITFEDGTKVWKCELCESRSPRPQGLAAHYNFNHVPGFKLAPRGSRKQKAEKEKVLRPPKITKPKPPKAQEVLDQLLKLVGPFFDQAETEALRQQVERLREEVVTRDVRIEELEGNLRALRDLIGGIK